MCTVFAESEVVSLVAQNKAVSDIIHGLNMSVASKVGALAARLGQDNPGEYMMTGGVAKNKGITNALEEKLTAIIQNNNIQSVTIVRMEVPCCGGLEIAAKKALQASGKFIPWQVVTISIDGKIME